MGDLRSRIEVTKLARELGVAESEIDFLTASAPEELRELREAVSTALFARNEDRVRLLASLSRMLPVPLTAKIAELALGPMLSSRVAGVLDPREATRLAGHLAPSFLADLSLSLDPARVAPIVRGLPDDLIVEVGGLLLERGEHVTLARFVAVVSPEVAMRVVERAQGPDLLQVALFADEPAALDALVRRLPDSTLADVIRAASQAQAYDAAVTLLSSLSPESCARLVAQVDAVAVEARESLVEAVAEHDMWPAILPALPTVEPGVLQALVNVPATLDVAIIERVVAHARTLDQAPLLVQLVLAMDDEHLEVLRGSTALLDPGLQEWLVTNAGVGERLVVPVLESLGLR